MTELGNPICTEEILRHHRDVCSNSKAYHTYGAIDSGRFKILANRYLRQAEDFSPTSISEIDLKLKDHGVFAFANNYKGTNHAMRAIGCSGQDIEFLVPAFPYGFKENATLDHAEKDWGATFITVHCPGP